MRINEVTYEKLKTPLKVNGNLKAIYLRRVLLDIGERDVIESLRLREILPDKAWNVTDLENLTVFDNRLNSFTNR